MATILVIAIIFSSFFKWRRYPAQLEIKQPVSRLINEGYAPITHGDFVYALSHIDTFVAIDEAGLLKIYSLATRRGAEEKTQ